MPLLAASLMLVDAVIGASRIDAAGVAVSSRATRSASSLTGGLRQTGHESSPPSHRYGFEVIERVGIEGVAPEHVRAEGADDDLRA